MSASNVSAVVCWPYGYAEWRTNRFCSVDFYNNTHTTQKSCEQLTGGFVLGAVLSLAVGIDESANAVVRVAVASWLEAALKCNNDHSKEVSVKHTS